MQASTSAGRSALSPIHQGPVCLCFALSGLASLVYQIAWTREFALVFGTAELAVATVLAAYMAGLALGAWLIQRWLVRIRRPVRLYAVLEVGIAFAAVLLVPAFLGLAERGLTTLFGSQPELPASGPTAHAVYYLISAFATLLIPTTLMGATLPLLVRAGVQRDEQVGARIGALYACNTAGAVAGALLSAFVLLPEFGLRATQWSAGGVNLLVCAIALLLARGQETPVVAGPSPAPTPVVLPGANWMLPLMLISGATAFTHEVLWTRLLQRVMGGSVLAFGIMVAAFLSGLALGAALGSRLAVTRQLAERAWIAAQVAIGVAALAAWYGLGAWGHADGPLWARAGFSLVLLMPLTMAIGTTYPLAVRVLAASAEDAPAASGRIYSWNTAGAILGSLVAGFLLIPALRYEGTLAVTVAVSGALAVAAAVLLRPTYWRWAVPLGAGVFAAGLFQPAVPEALLHLSPVRAATGPVVYYAVGRSADVVVTRELRSLAMMSNGLPEAAIPLAGAGIPASIESWMGSVPVLARPDIRHMLVVGLGGGNVINGIPPSVQDIDVIELEPQVVLANQAVAQLRDRDPLGDSRVRIVLNDARGGLALTNKRYDAILSQPSHPWTSGASHLYTREFLLQARSHLQPGGVFVQWMGAEFLDEGLLKSLVATLHDVFAEVRLYRTGPTALLFLASDAPLEPELYWQRPGATTDSAALHYRRIGLSVPENLVAALALDTVGATRLAAGSPPITDDRNRLATAGVQERNAGMNGPRVTSLLAPYDPLTHADSAVHRGRYGSLAFEYIWRTVSLSAPLDELTIGRLDRLADLLGDTDQAAYLRFQMAIRRKRPGEAAQVLSSALTRWPQSALLNYATVEDALPSLSTGEVPAIWRDALARQAAEPALVLRGVRAAGAQDWNQVAQLDQQLATVRWTAPWGMQAAQLRVEWRARVQNPELRQRFGEEGIAIADRAIAIQPDAFWYSLRALSAAGTHQPAIALESIGAFADTTLNALPDLTAADRAAIRQRAATLQELLEEIAADGQVRSDRVGEISAALRFAYGRLQ